MCKMDSYWSYFTDLIFPLDTTGGNLLTLSKAEAFRDNRKVYQGGDLHLLQGSIYYWEVKQYSIQFNSIQFIHTYSHNVNLQEWKERKKKNKGKVATCALGINLK